MRGQGRNPSFSPLRVIPVGHPSAKGGCTKNSNVETLYKLANGKAEALEFIIKENSAVAGIPLQDLRLRKNTLIGCIYRNGKVILPGGQDMMMAGDSVLVVLSGYRISDIQEILED